MATICFLLSHRPNPRICRRMIALQEEYGIELIYWDRCIPREASYSVPAGVITHRICVPAPRGNWLKRILPLVNFGRLAIRMLRKLRPNAIHCGNLDMLAVGWIYKRTVDPGVKLVYEIGDLPKVTYNRSTRLDKVLLRTCFMAVEKKLCRDVNLLVVTSPYFWVDYYYRLIPAERTLFIPNAPERRIFTKVSPRRYGSTLTVGFIGSVRYPDQLKILADAVRDMPDVRVLVAGEGPALQEMEEYCAGMDNVEFYGPYNYENEVAVLYSRVDCIYAVYDTRIDNVRVALPNRLYEAVVSGRPIIVAEGTALARFVREQGVGYVVPDRDVFALRQLLRALVAHPEEFTAIEERARAIKEAYFAEVNYDLLRNSYKKVLSG